MLEAAVGTDAARTIDDLLEEGVLRDAAFGRLQVADLDRRTAAVTGADAHLRRRAHVLIARALEQIAPDAAAELLDHWYAAGADPSRVVRYGVAAAHHAAAQFAWCDAAEHLERAVEADGLLPEEPRRRAELLVALAEAARRAGLLDRAASASAEAAQLARAVRDHRLLAAAVLARPIAGRMMPPGVAIVLLEEALPGLASGADELRVRVLIDLAGTRAETIGLEAAALPLAKEAVRLAKAIGDQALIAAATYAWHYASLDLAPPQERLEILAGMPATAGWERPPGFPIEAAKVVDLLQLGRLDEVRRLVALATERVDAQGEQAQLWYAHVWKAMLALLENRLADADAAVADAFAVARTAGASRWVVDTTGPSFVLRWLDGRLAELEQEVTALAEERPEWDCARAFLLAEVGRLDEAATLLRAAAAVNFRVRPAMNTTLSRALWAGVAAATGDRDSARLLYELLTPHAEEWVVLVPTASMSFGPVSYWLAKLASVLGRHDAADLLAKRAAASAEDVGAASFVALARRTEFHSPASAQRPLTPLTAREREVLGLMANGERNSDIARRLGIAHKTVKNHVSSILAKLAVSDRTQAALWAAQAGYVDDTRES